MTIRRPSATSSERRPAPSLQLSTSQSTRRWSRVQGPPRSRPCPRIPPAWRAGGRPPGHPGLPRTGLPWRPPYATSWRLGKAKRVEGAMARTGASPRRTSGVPRGSGHNLYLCELVRESGARVEPGRAALAFRARRPLPRTPRCSRSARRFRTSRGPSSCAEPTTSMRFAARAAAGSASSPSSSRPRPPGRSWTRSAWPRLRRRSPALGPRTSPTRSPRTTDPRSPGARARVRARRPRPPLWIDQRGPSGFDARTRFANKFA